LLDEWGDPKMAVRQNVVGHTGTDRLGGGDSVSEFVVKLKDAVSPQMLRDLGLTRDWYKSIPQEYVQEVLNKAGRYKKVLRELSKL